MPSVEAKLVGLAVELKNITMLIDRISLSNQSDHDHLMELRHDVKNCANKIESLEKDGKYASNTWSARLWNLLSAIIGALVMWQLSKIG